MTALQTRRRIVTLLAVVAFLLCLQLRVDLLNTFKYSENLTTSQDLSPSPPSPPPPPTYNSLLEYDDASFAAMSVLRQNKQDPLKLEKVELLMNISAAEIPKPRTISRPGTRYLSYMPYAGLTNQFMALEKAAYLAKRLNRTLVIPPIISNSHDTHNTNQRWSDFFDLEQFTELSGIPAVEWSDLRPLSQEQAYIGRQKAELKERTYDLWDALVEDLPCQIVYGFGGSEALHNTELTFARQFLFRPRFVAPPARDPKTVVYDRATIGVKDNSNMEDIVTIDDLVDRYTAHEDKEPMLFLSHSFKLKDPIGPRSWEQAGQHLHFRRKVNEYAARLLRHRIPELGLQGRYIAIHIRRGDIWQKCRTADADAMMRCVTPLGHYAEAVEAARALAQEKRLPVIVATDSKSSEDHQTIAKLGWRRLNHELYITEQELGVFGPALVDAAILANADYFIGTYKSTMTKVAAERQKSWHQRETLYPRVSPSWVPPS